VISVIAKRGREGMRASAFAEYGSCDTSRVGGAVSGGAVSGGAVSGSSAIGDFAVRAARMSTEGFSAREDDLDDDGHASLTFNAKAGLNLPGDARLGLALRRATSDAEFDPSFGSGSPTVATEDRAAALSLAMPVLGDRADIAAQVGYGEVARACEPSFGPPDSNGERRFARLQGNVEITPTDTLSLGVAHERITGYGTFLSRDSHDISSVFALRETRPLDGPTICTGLRQDEHPEFDGNPSGRASAAHAPSDSMTLRGGCGAACKAPTLSQIATGFPNAKPETSRGWEPGADCATPDGRFAAGLTPAQQDLTDEIDFASPNDFHTNLDAAGCGGVEATGDARLSPSFVLTGAYTYLAARDADTGARATAPTRCWPVMVAARSGGCCRPPATTAIPTRRARWRAGCASTSRRAMS
jgi:outer membrane cobalamin receptor